MRREKWFVSLLICVLAMCFMSVTAFAADTAKVAEVNGKQYDTLAGALAEAKASDTVKLLTDVTESVKITQDITLNLGGHTLTSPSTANNAVVIVNSAVIIEDGNLTGGLRCVVEIKSGTQQQLTLKGVTVTSANGAGGIWDFGTKSSVTLTDCDVSGDYFAVYHNGSTAGFTLTATDSTITAIEGSVPDAAAIYVSGSSKNIAEDRDGMNMISLTGCTVTGPTGIEGKYTNMSLIDCDITATVDIDYSQNNDGSTALGFAVVSTDNSINGTTPSPQSSITINGGSYTGAIGLSQFEDYKDNENFKEATYVVTSGTFSGDVSDYLAEDADNVEYNTVLKAPTCTVNGIGKRITIVDGETTTSYYVLPAAHKADEAVIEIEKEASCTESGSYSSVVYCSVCNEKLSSETVNIPAKGHTEPEKGVTVTAATCAKDGSKSYTCVVCKENVTEVIPATGIHRWEDIKYIEPTCTENGKADGQVCSVCGTVNPDNMPIDLGEVAPATGHKWILNEEAEDYQAATCVTDGVGTYTCSVCHETKTETIPATGKHTEEVVAAKAADCGNAGCTDGVKCSVCGEILFGCEEIPATGEHTEEVVPGKAPTCKDTGLTEGKKCSVCGEVLVAQEAIPVDPDAHTYELSATLKAATCTTTGIGKYVCTECGAYKYTTIPAAHSWNEGSVTIEATCGEDGEKTYTCTVEGCGATKTEVIPATGEHNYQEKVVEATCTANTKVGFVCSVCGAVDPDRETVEIPDTMIPHDYEEVVVAATCTEDGSITKTCKLCGDEVVEVLPAIGHKAGEPEYIDATCTENGKEVVKCSVCGEILEENDLGELDPATGHTEEIIPAVPATCGATGMTEGVKCSVCGEILVAQEEIAIDENAHKYEVIALKEATCSATGIGKYTCSICGDYYYGIIEKTEHSFNDEGSEVIKEPTCIETGILIVKCSVCNATEERPIEALGHDWSEEMTSEDSTYVYKECTRCHETEIIAWLSCEHETTELQNAKEATCTEAGYTGDEICTKCGETVKTGEEIPALGHTSAEAVRENEVAATCTEAGSYDEVVYCSVCGEEISRETKNVEAAGHTEEIVEGKAATCTEAGLTEGKKCSVCGETLVAQEEIPALGHTEVTDEAVEASCGSSGKTEGSHCSECGEIIVAQEIVPATGRHAYESVINGDGSITYTCPDCGDTFTEAAA